MLEKIKEGIRAAAEDMFVNDRHHFYYTIPKSWVYNEELEAWLTDFSHQLIWSYVFSDGDNVELEFVERKF